MHITYSTPFTTAEIQTIISIVGTFQDSNATQIIWSTVQRKTVPNLFSLNLILKLTVISQSFMFSLL